MNFILKFDQQILCIRCIMYMILRTNIHKGQKFTQGVFPRSFLPAPMMGIGPYTLVVVAESAWT